VTLVLTGTGDVLEPQGGIAAIGSGGNYALAAARALADSDYDAEAISRRAMGIAAELCIYTNDQLTVETIGGEAKPDVINNAGEAKPDANTNAGEAKPDAKTNAGETK
jgi:hypothetical protein